MNYHGYPQPFPVVSVLMRPSRINLCCSRHVGNKTRSLLVPSGVFNKCECVCVSCQLQESFLRCCLLCFLRQGLSLASEDQRSACVRLPSTGVTGTSRHNWLFKCGFRVWDSASFELSCLRVPSAGVTGMSRRA